MPTTQPVCSRLHREVRQGAHPPHRGHPAYGDGEKLVYQVCGLYERDRSGTRRSADHVLKEGEKRRRRAFAVLSRHRNAQKSARSPRARA